MGKVFTEKYSDVKASFSLEVSRIIYSGKSEFQKIEIFESPFFGKVLVIDDCIMLTERDEFIYHEMIAHVALYVHPHPSKVLVIGGGDGGTVREVLKHQDVQEVLLVDIDRMVSEVCLKYFPEISSQLSSDKLTCQFQDGVKYVRNTKDKFDLIIIDSTDPISVGEGLFTQQFYQDCRRILNTDGILINQAESPIFTQKWLQDISRKLRPVFPGLDFYHAHIPTYPSGYWLFGFASKKYHPLKDFRRNKFKQQNLSLNYYNPELHKAAFVLPNYVRKLVHDR